MPIPVEAFFIDRTSPVPLQVQLRRQIVEGVTEGRFRPGDGLPSSRRRRNPIVGDDHALGALKRRVAGFGCVGHLPAPPGLQTAPHGGRQPGLQIILCDDTPGILPGRRVGHGRPAGDHRPPQFQTLT